MIDGYVVYTNYTFHCTKRGSSFNVHIPSNARVIVLGDQAIDHFLLPVNAAFMRVANFSRDR
jgi:hypothetical protein